MRSAVDAGATTLEPVVKTFWGYGGVAQAPDGSVWRIATSSKRNAGPAALAIDEIVMLVGVTDFVASKRCDVGRGFTAAKSFGRSYVRFDAPSNGVKLALDGRCALAKDAGLPVGGSGSHRIVLGSTAAAFTDPDGFRWETDQVPPLTTSVPETLSPGCS